MINYVAFAESSQQLAIEYKTQQFVSQTEQNSLYFEYIRFNSVNSMYGTTVHEDVFCVFHCPSQK